MWEVEGVYFPEAFVANWAHQSGCLFSLGQEGRARSGIRGGAEPDSEYLSGSASQGPFWAVTPTPLLGPLQTPLLNPVSQPGYKSLGKARPAHTS